MKRILFVDDDPLVLQGYRRMLHSMRNEWDMRFASSGAQALQLMAESPADVLVSDMNMPQMNGAKLLNQVAQIFPKTIRIILSGYADMEMTMECVGSTHQFLCKPCESKELFAAISRAVELDPWLRNDQFKGLISRLKTVPSPPVIYFRILKQVNSLEIDLSQVGDTIAQDPAMTAKILQLVNSAFFGLARRLSDPVEAVTHLGLETIKSLVLAVHVFAEFESSGISKLAIESVHQHCLSTGVTARNIARLEKSDKNMQAECFTAGLLHDIGQLVLLANLPELCAEALALARREKVFLSMAETSVLGVNHGEVGGYLLGLWGLPVGIVEAARFHHTPRWCKTQGFTPLTATHVANSLEEDHPDLKTEMDREYLTKVGVWDRVASWQQTLGK